MSREGGGREREGERGGGVDEGEKGEGGRKRGGERGREGERVLLPPFSLLHCHITWCVHMCRFMGNNLISRVTRLTFAGILNLRIL